VTRSIGAALAAVFGCLALAGTPAMAAPPRPPDVLLLAVDGLGTGTSPAVDALAKRGRAFDRAYLAHPLAGPSRAALFLGMRPERYDVLTELLVRPPGALLLPERLAQGGYRTARVGRAVSEAFDAQIKWDRVVAPTAAADTAGQIAALLHDPGDAPLFVAAGFDDLGPPVTIAKSAAAGPPAPERPAIAVDDLLFTSPPGTRRTVPAVDESARRQALLAQEQRQRRFDAQLARLMATLDRERRWEHTIVVLAGLQPPAQGAHGLLPRPDDLFEDGLRTPLVIAAPDLAQPGRPTSALVEIEDLYPTLLELAGQPPVAGLDGISQAAALRDPKAETRDTAVSVAWRDPGHVGRSLRTARWRYTQWPEGSQELYDHRTDPQEHMNLAGRKDRAPVVAGMQSQIASRLRDFASPPLAGPATRTPARRPNVLLVIFDDLNVHVGSFGYSVKTPNLDRLARLGRRFEHAYAQVAQCSPSRTSLLSGWQPERTNVWNNTLSPRRPGMVPLQEHFGANGYYTAQIGKIWETSHSGDFRWDRSEYDPLPPGATSNETRADARDDDDSERKAKKQGKLGWWAATDGGDADEPDGRRARLAAQLILEKRDKPFFIAVGFAKPHLRWLVPRRYFDMYDPAQIRFPAPPTPAELAFVPAIALRHRIDRPGEALPGHEPSMLPEEKLRREAIAAYHATVTFVDAQFGVLLDALDRGRLWDDTIVVVLGDHGYHLGEHGGLWRKDTLFEEGLRIPFMIAGPGVARPGVAAAAPVELLDLYPTLVDLAGLPRPAGLDGRSLAPLLADPTAQLREGALSWRPVAGTGLAVSLRKGRWRYTQWPDGSEELFDIEADPQQLVNRAWQSPPPASLQEMRLRRAKLAP
jgi:arylsulfatase A-like enzyme